MLNLLVHGLLKESETLLTYKALLLTDSDFSNIGICDERCAVLECIEMAVEQVRQASDNLRDAVAFLDTFDALDSDADVPL
ncbi:MAG: hypothetical protein HKM01_08420 [Gallionella sp.]|nr:hypothetical protein [Gallionella sp.]